uniref:Scaffolding protein n=1 Tax=viral metagenome TaxID=1070528 RepID=A0A6M3JYF1_9ZZZZ
MDTLEGAEAQVEETNEAGTQEKTQQKAEPTVGDITKTKEFKEALDKALGKSTSSLQTQVTLAKDAAKKAEIERDNIKSSLTHKDSDIEFLTNKLNQVASEKFGDDEEVLKGFKNSLSHELRERQLNSRKEQLDRIEAEQEGFRTAYQLGQKALELRREYQVPDDILEMCTSVEQMEKIAVSFPKSEGTRGGGQKFDSTISQGGEMSDDAFEKAWGDGSLPNTSENYKRAKALLDKYAR